MIALTDPIPLRQNTAWGTFPSTAAVYIPHRYGACGGALVQYDRQRTQFVWADHPVESIDDVLVNGVAATGWTWANTKDVTGHAVAMVTFNQAVDLGATVIARGKGKQHPGTGARMTDPAAIAWDILANICGRDVTESSFAEFSAACSARGLEASGSIESADPVMAILIAVCSSVGGLYSSATKPVLWPGGSVGPVLSQVSPTQGHTLTASAKIADIVNDLTIRYEFESGSPRQSLQLEAPDSVAKFGRRKLVIDAAWISAARTAYDVAARLLAQRARAQWTTRAEGLKRAMSIGQAVSLAHPVIPVGGSQTVLTTEYDFSTALTAIELSVPVGSSPAVRIVQQSQAFDPQSYAGIGVQTIGNDRVLTITNDDGTPTVNAAVTLDGKLTRFSDSSGHVAFPATAMPAGAHTIDILTSDGRALSTTVLV
jgi:hypothetical protein